MNLTLGDLATAAGVSKATVSRVINERGNVSEETAQRVRAVMAQSRFPVPPPKPLRGQQAAAAAASAAASSRRASGAEAGPSAATISAHALLVPEISGDLYVSLLHGFEVACQARGRKTIICNTQDNVLKQADDILQLIHARVGGIAIVPVSSAPTPVAHLAVLRGLGIPTVLLHRDVEGADVPLIALPLREIGARAGHELTARGHRRIAFFTSEHSRSGLVHQAGLEDALRSAGLALPAGLICRCAGAIPLSMRALEESVARYVAALWPVDPPAGHEPPTAAYATSNVIAEVLYLKLAEHGLKVGRDVSILTCGATERTGPLSNRLSSIVVDEYEIGRSAVDLLEAPDPAAQSDAAAARLLRRIEPAFFDADSLGLAGPPR